MSADNSDTSFIRPQWLLPKSPGMQCQPHSRILGMFALYNFVAVAMSYILAMPFFFKRYRRGLDACGRTCTRVGRALLGRPHPQIEETDRPYSSRRHTTLAMVMSIGGSLAFSVAAPVLTAFVLARPNREEVDPWGIIQQWATRPRASWMIFLVHAVLGRIQVKWNQPTSDDRLQGQGDSDDAFEPAHGFYVTAASAVLNEAVINLLGIRYLWEQARGGADRSSSAGRSTRSTYTMSGPRPPMMQQGAQAMAGTIMFWECLFGVYVLVGLLCLAVVGRRKLWGEGSSTSSSKPFRWDVWGLTGAFIPLAILSIPIYALSWHLWRGFLGVVPESLYCVEGSAAIDAIYCVLPVCLGLWRMAWAAKA